MIASTFSEINKFCKEQDNDFKVTHYQLYGQLIQWATLPMTLLLGVSTYLNHAKYDVESLLYSYLLPMILLIFYSFLHWFGFHVSRYSAIILNLISASTLLGVIHIIYEIIRINNFVPNSPVVITLSACCMISPHRNNLVGIFRNLAFSLMFAIGIYLIDPRFFEDSIINLFQGFLIGSFISSASNLFFKTWYYTHSLASQSTRHAHEELSKTVLPHQMSKMKAGYTIQETMLIGQGDGVVINFDIQASSKIDSHKKIQYLNTVIKDCDDELMINYKENPLQANGYRLKHTGDGLLALVGYPIPAPKGKNEIDLALEIAISFTKIMDQENKEFQVGDVFGSVSLIPGKINGFFTNTERTTFEVNSLAITLSDRYEKIRKIVLPRIGCRPHHFIVTNSVGYSMLSDDHKKKMNEFDLVKENIKIRDDYKATSLYYAIIKDGQAVTIDGSSASQVLPLQKKYSV